MKKLALSILTLALFSTAWAQKLDRSVRPKPGPAPEIKLGKTESFTLPNGLRVFVVENHKLPTVAYSIQLDVKPELEGNMAGYRDMMSELLTSGTKTRSNDELNKEIDYIGVTLRASDESVYGSGLKKHQAKLLELMSDITINSDFKQTELDKIKKRALSGLEAEKNEPDAMLANVTNVVNYSSAHPYGEIPNDETVESITLERCRKYYNTYFRPNVAYMAVVGDITMSEVKPLVEKYFGSWQKADVPVAKYPDPKKPNEVQLAFVPREAAVQSVINVTYPIDLQPGEADVIKAKVTNAILGGGSQGRLFLNLREKHGWTYGSYSSINQDDLKGEFTAYAKCRNAVSDSSVGEIIAEMRRMQNEKISQKDLQDYIVNLSGSFAMGLENPATVAQYAINIERYHMPKDYYQNYLKSLSAVTPEDVQAMAKKYITPEKANIVVVGSKDEVAKTLTKFAKNVTYYDNYGREIKPTSTAAAPAGLKADDVRKKYIAAIGGEKAINSVKDIKTVSKGVISMGGQEIPLTITEMKKAPSQMKSMIEGMGMVFQKVVLNGDKGYQEAQGQKADLEGNDLNDTKMQADLYADLHPEKYGIKRSIKGMEKMGSNDVYILEVTDADGKKSTEYYDVQSGYLVKEISTEDAGPQGSITATTEYSDYKEIPGGGGLKIPYTVKRSAGGQDITAKVEVAEVNKGIADSEFN